MQQIMQNTLKIKNEIMDFLLIVLFDMPFADRFLFRRKGILLCKSESPLCTITP